MRGSAGWDVWDAYLGYFARAGDSFLVWAQLTAHAAKDGVLRPGVNPRILAGPLIGAFDVVVRNWLREDCTQRRFGSRLGYALAAGLGSACREREHGRLEALRESFQGNWNCWCRRSRSGFWHRSTGRSRYTTLSENSLARVWRASAQGDPG